jgi:hypothetical protein
MWKIDWHERGDGEDKGTSIGLQETGIGFSSFFFFFFQGSWKAGTRMGKSVRGIVFFSF